MSSKNRIGEQTKESRALGSSMEKGIGKLTIRTRIIILILLFSLLISSSVSVYALLRSGSMLSSISESEYRRVARYVDGRKWIASEYELRELREFIYREADGSAETLSDGSTITLVLGGNLFVRRISFLFDDGQIVSEDIEGVLLHYTESEKKEGEALVIETEGRTIVFYPER